MNIKMQLYKHFGHFVDRFCFVSLRLEFSPAFFFAENRQGGRAAKSKETKRISSHLRPCFSCFSTPKHPLTHVLINNSSRRALLDAMARWWFYRILTLFCLCTYFLSLCKDTKHKNIYYCLLFTTVYFC